MSAETLIPVPFGLDIGAPPVTADTAGSPITTSRQGAEPVQPGGRQRPTVPGNLKGGRDFSRKARHCNSRTAAVGELVCPQRDVVVVWIVRPVVTGTDRKH